MGQVSAGLLMLGSRTMLPAALDPHWTGFWVPDPPGQGWDQHARAARPSILTQCWFVTCLLLQCPSMSCAYRAVLACDDQRMNLASRLLDVEVAWRTSQSVHGGGEHAG